MLPSPTAEATRFTGPERTSPQAKMPGDARLQQHTGIRSSCRLPVIAHVSTGHVTALVECRSLRGASVSRRLRRMNRNRPPEASRLRLTRVRVPGPQSRPASPRPLLRPPRSGTARRRWVATRAARSGSATFRPSRPWPAWLPRQSIVTTPGVVREEHRRLPSRVPGPDDVDVEAVRVPRLAARRSVEDALPDESIEPLDGELPPRHTAREDDLFACRTSPPSRCT